MSGQYQHMDADQINLGPLFLPPDLGGAREQVVQRDRSLTNKVVDLPQILRQHLTDACYLAVGGFSSNRIPVAALHEILRMNPQGLAFSGHTSTHDFQILCAGNLTNRGQLLSKVDIAYIVGLEARGLSPHARRVIESGEVTLCEWTNYSLALRYKAAAMGVPFLPCRTMLGTDTLKYSAAKVISCPFTGIPLVVVPALFPDVAIIHVHEADIYGNCAIFGPSVADIDLARAAKTVIITCERLVPTDTFRQNPNRTVIPFFCVDAVCEVPYGSYPGNMPGEYFSDEDHLHLWLKAEKDPAEFQKFLEDYILGSTDFEEYLRKCGGLKNLQRLRHQELRLDTGTPN
ncbi:MAG: CoA-transferase [Zavarzinella sp.]